MSGTPADPSAPLLSGGAPPPPPGPPEPPPVTPPAPSDDSEIRLTSKQLNERLARERSKVVRDMGFDSEEAMREAHRQVEAQRQATLTKEQKLEEENNKLRKERDEAQAAREEAQFEARLGALCATRGIKEVGYARYLIEGVAGENEQFDAGAFLDQEMQNPARRAAFGFTSPPTPVDRPITTTPVSPNSPVPAPNQNNQPPIDAMKLDAAGLREYERNKYARP